MVRTTQIKPVSSSTGGFFLLWPSYDLLICICSCYQLKDTPRVQGSRLIQRRDLASSWNFKHTRSVTFRAFYEHVEIVP